MPRPSLVTSSGPSPVRGFMAAMPCTSSWLELLELSHCGTSPLASLTGPALSKLAACPVPSSQIRGQSRVCAARGPFAAGEDAGVDEHQPAVIYERSGPDGSLCLLYT